MTVIRIKEFFGYSLDSFSEYVSLHRRSFIDVVLPKEYDDKNPALLAEDYYRAVYAGQLLSRISHDLLFTSPHPAQKGEFSFIIITSKWKTLAKLLFLFSQAYDVKDNLDAYIAFSDAAYQIDGYLKEGEELVCGSYLNMIEDYLDEE
jgi:hypothetical protein